MNTVTEISIILTDEEMKLLDNIKSQYGLSSYRDAIVNSIRAFNNIIKLNEVKESRSHMIKAIQEYKYTMRKKRLEEERNKRYENNI